MEKKTPSATTEYLLCFPPRAIPAGNFFRQLAAVLRWQPEVAQQYSYSPVLPETREEVVQDISCLFMKGMPLTSRGDCMTQLWLKRKVRKYMLRMEARTAGKIICGVHQMQDSQDLPYSLKLSAARDYLEQISYGKKTRIGIIEGDAVSRKDLIALLRRYYDKMNYLTIFTGDVLAYAELTEDAWEQFGLAVTVTKSLKEIRLCDYILDCSHFFPQENTRCHQGCNIFALWAGQKKIRSIRRMGEGISFDSCANVLDRAFENKV